MKKEKDPWVDHILAKTVWPNPSPDLKERIMMGINGSPPSFLGGTRRPMLASLFLFIMALGFVMGLATNTASIHTSSTYATMPFYTGAGTLLVRIFEA